MVRPGRLARRQARPYPRLHHAAGGATLDRSQSSRVVVRASQCAWSIWYFCDIIIVPSGTQSGCQWGEINLVPWEGAARFVLSRFHRISDSRDLQRCISRNSCTDPCPEGAIHLLHAEGRFKEMPPFALVSGGSDNRCPSCCLTHEDRWPATASRPGTPNIQPST
jgi:hypothetical protein